MLFLQEMHKGFGLKIAVLDSGEFPKTVKVELTEIQLSKICIVLANYYKMNVI